MTPNEAPQRSPEAERAVVLFSGGQDSTTCLYWAKRRFSEVLTVGFDYGQKHAIELQQAQKIAQLAEVPFSVIDLRGSLRGSALTEHDQDVTAPHPRASELPASFVPARNAVFLTHAAGFAFNHDAQHLVGGMCQTDYSGYPDCRQEFVEAMQKALSLGLGRAMQIHTPLMHLSKAETWKLAYDLDVLDIVRDMSHTDYNGDRTQRHEWGYGRLDNPASELRARGYAEAKANGWLGPLPQ